MNIIQKNINEIRPDTNQPRKNFPETRIREMAKSILTEGIINPIEVDKDGVIVTGEIRWRSAKEAGLKTVPVKVIDPGKTRFRRQVVENVHHNTMTTMDTSRALSKLLSHNKLNAVQNSDYGEQEVLKLANENRSAYSLDVTKWISFVINKSIKGNG